METLHDVMRAAKSRGLKWAEVKRTANSLKAIEAEARNRDREIRTAVWGWYAIEDTRLLFWRTGMHTRFARAFADGDRTLIPGFDVVAQAVAASFPEFATNDPAEAVFEYLARNDGDLSAGMDIWREALELAGGLQDTGHRTDATDFPFGWNLIF